MSALVALGLFWVQLRARRAQPALDKDLHDALGARWRSQASMPSTSPTPAARSGLAWRHGILLPFGRRRPGVERWRDLRYGPDARAPARRVRGLHPGDGAAGRASARRRIRPGREESREPGASAAARRTRLMRHQRELPTSRRRSVPRVATRRRPRDRAGGRARRSPRRRHAADLRISRTARRRPVVFTHIPDPPRRLVAGHDRARGRARHRARPRAGARGGRDDPRGILVTRPPTPSCPRRSTDSTCPSCPGHHAPPASLSAARSARERPPPI